jgi:hypothetical protein
VNIPGQLSAAHMGSVNMYHVIRVFHGMYSKQQLLGRYSTLKQAQALADRKDLEYGATVHFVKWVA